MMGRVAARTRGSTTRHNLVRGGIYAFIGVVHLALFLALVFIYSGGGGGFIPPIYWPVMSVCYLGLASLYLIPGVASYRCERSPRNAASRP
jgi:hypothetical protein